jgi:hypothetical protein
MTTLADLRFLAQRVLGRTAPPGRCSHLGFIQNVAQTSEGCLDCLAVGDTWVHLRSCATCGRVGCCDSSKNRHAHRHADQAGHPIAASIEPGEDWLWCYRDQTLVTAIGSADV